MNKKLQVWLCVLVLTSSVLSGAEPPLVTDRPDQSDSPITVPRGLFQIEGGWRYGERDDATGKLELQEFPGALLRFGVTEKFELRLGLPGISVISGDDRETFLVDATLGMKLGILEQDGAVPDVAFVGTLLVPSGDDEVSSDRVDPGFRFAFGNQLSTRVSLTYNVGMFWLTERDPQAERDTRSFLDWTATVGVSANDRLGVFGELFGVTGVSAESRPLTSLGGGVTYLLGSRVQVDGRVTAGLSSAALDWTAGIGVAYRFPSARD